MTTTEKSGQTARKRSQKRSLIGILALLAGLVGGSVWLMKTRPPALLRVAAKVTTKGKYSGHDLAWVSNEEYVCVSSDGRTLLRCRLSDGTSTPLIPPLDDLSEASGLQVLPNRKWVSWNKLTYTSASFRSGMYNGSIRSYPYLTRLSDTRTPPLRSMADGQWEPDSRHLFLFGTLVTMSDKNRHTVQPSVFISDAFAAGDSRNVPIEPSVVSALSETIMVAPNRLLGISQEDDLPKGPAELYEYRLDKTLHRTRNWLVMLPPHTIGWEGKIAPEGERVAWLVTTEYVDPALATLHRFLPVVNAPSQSHQELWISRLDGTKMQMVGQIPTRFKNGDQLLISDLQWLPDGHHLSFTYDGALWKAPTPQ